MKSCLATGKPLFKRIFQGIRGASISGIYCYSCGVSIQVEVAFWDTAGQERFHSLAPLYYRDADAALLVSAC